MKFTSTSKALPESTGYYTVKLCFGDVLWNISQLCNHYGWKLSDVMRENIDKLRDRAKRGVIHGSGDNR